MSTNDAIVLKANFEEWKERVAGLKGVQPWLYYGVEQFLKPFAFDDEDIRYGITDGGNDGGADAMYVLVNQRQLVEEDTTLDPKAVTKLRLIIIQSKESGGFKPTEIEKWIGLSDDLLDLSKHATGFGQLYNDRVVRMMRIWKENYIRLANVFPETNVDFYYITGDDVYPDDYSIDSGNRVKNTVKNHIKCECNVHFIGAQ